MRSGCDEGLSVMESHLELGGGELGVMESY